MNRSSDLLVGALNSKGSVCCQNHIILLVTRAIQQQEDVSHLDHWLHQNSGDCNNSLWKIKAW